MLNLTGQTIGRLEVIFEAPSIKRAGQQGRGSDRYWFCLCECGNMVAVRQECLRGENPKTRSCGCLQKEEAAAKRIAKVTTPQSVELMIPVWKTIILEELSPILELID